MIAPCQPSDRPELLAELLVHVGRAARTDDGGSELTSAQWSALRFCSRANDRTRTPSGFASFQATTRGTASQIIQSLVGLGLLARTTSDSDRRSVRLDLTKAGRALLARDPLGHLIGVIAALSADERAQFQNLLTRVVAAMAEGRQAAAFGTCADCCHFTPIDGGGSCACMDAALGPDELTQLCGSFRGPAAHNGDSHGTA